MPFLSDATDSVPWRSPGQQPSAFDPTVWAEPTEPPSWVPDPPAWDEAQQTEDWVDPVGAPPWHPLADGASVADSPEEPALPDTTDPTVRMRWADTGLEPGDYVWNRTTAQEYAAGSYDDDYADTQTDTLHAVGRTLPSYTAHPTVDGYAPDSRMAERYTADFYGAEPYARGSSAADSYAFEPYTADLQAAHPYVTDAAETYPAQPYAVDSFPADSSGTGSYDTGAYAAAPFIPAVDVPIGPPPIMAASAPQYAPEVSTRPTVSPVHGNRDALTIEAFQSLPVRWQEVLWFTCVERVSVTEASVHIGLSREVVAAIELRAREGLRRAWLESYLDNESLPTSCSAVLQELSAYARGTLLARDADLIEAHLAACDRCRGVDDELAELLPALPEVLLPVALANMEDS